jgi:hypothetical protein
MIEVIITTCERPGPLGKLLDDIECCAPPGTIVHVYDDASQASYAEIQERLDASGWHMTRAVGRSGREGFWRWLQRIYAERIFSPASEFVLLPDDVRLCREFFTRARALWHSIDDDRKIALNVFRDARASGPQWTEFYPHPVGQAILTQWIDGAFYCTRRYFEVLGWSVPQVSPSWHVDPQHSSGVYRLVSQALAARRLTCYCTAQSLVEHAPGESIMHPVTRVDAPLRAVNYIDEDGGFAGEGVRLPDWAGAPWT